ncbi:MAG TPA: TonB-dependent receptor [Paludibacter sp.]
MNHQKIQKRKSLQFHFRESISTLMIMFVCFLFSPANIFAQGNQDDASGQQQITVKGKVFDETNSPVIGASILVAGTKVGTITDINGNFTIKAPANGTLTISYIGYVPQKLKVSANLSNIVLKEDAAKLDEVVVVGYGQVKRANLTGAVGNLSMKQVEDFPAPNLASVISGTMPGVHVSEPTGNPLGEASISVRINGSFSSTGEPLYVIDGFIRDVTAFNMIDPSEIESISVLKDASASVYGVRGSNGVVLVSTKKGKSGKPKVSYSASYGTNQGVQMPEMMSAYEQGVALNDLWAQEITYKHSTTNYTFFSDQELAKLKTLDYNWLEKGWHDSNNTRHTLNVTGGSETVRYFIGGSYMFANGNFSNLSLNRYGIKFGVEAEITKNLKGNFSMDYSQKDANQPLNSLDSEADRMYGTFSELARTPRYLPSYINDLPVNTVGGINALEMLNSGSYRKNNTSSLSTGMSLDYSFSGVKGLKLSISGNYSRNSGYGKQLSKPYYIYSFTPDTQYPHLFSTEQLPITDSNYKRIIYNGDKIYESADFSYSYQLNPQISYARKFGKHDLNAMVVYEQSESGGNGLSESRQTVVIPNYEVMAGYTQSTQTTASNISTLTRRQSFIGRLNYSFADKYFLESAFRYEASTNFAPEYRWGLFPSVSLGWRVSEEAFFKDNVTFMTNLKLRASAGRLGDDRVSANQWRSSYGLNGSTLIGGGTLSTNLKPQNGGLVYYNASWEKSDNYNAGIDMQFFNELSVSVDGFYKHTFDIINTPQSTFPQSAGITGTIPKLNYGIQNAWGGEADITYNKKINKDFSFQIKGNFAYAMNKVIKKYQNPGVVGTWADENGKVSGGEVGFTSMGIARNQADIDNYIAYLKSNYETYHGGLDESKIMLMNKFGTADMKPGMLMYKDVGSASYQDADGNWHDGAPDGIIDENDQRIISKYSFNPYNYGFSLGVTWKNISVNAMFTGAFGSNVVFEKGFWTSASGGGRSGEFLSQYSNQLKEWSGNYWTESNVNAKYPRLDDYSLRGYRSTFWMRDGHELHLKTINVSYTLPTSILKHVGIDQCRVFCQGSNILTIINPYPYKDASVGFWSDYPMIRTINFGLNLMF